MEPSHWLNEANALQLGVSAMDLHFLALNIHHLSHNVQKLDTPFLRENQVNKQDRLKFLSLLGILRSGINVLHFFFNWTRVLVLVLNAFVLRKCSTCTKHVIEINLQKIER